LFLLCSLKMKGSHAKHAHPYQSIGNEEDKEYPKGVSFIMLTELCERFSFYGLRGVMPLYLNESLGMSQTNSTAIVHGFIMFAYICPLFGGYIADSFLGKFKTIFYVSLIYCVGSVTLALTSVELFAKLSTPTPYWGLFVGLFIIGLATGSMKPCVSAFLGDQFKPHQTHMIDTIFHVFYFMVSLGSVSGTLLTPLIRTKYGYSMAFGFPAIFLVLTAIIFRSGKRLYTIHPPKGSILLKSLHIIGIGISEKLKSFFSSRKKEKTDPELTWHYAAMSRYPKENIDDVKTTLQVLSIFLPFPLFWSLYSQYASTWVFQAKLMDRNLFGYEIAADAIPALNPFLLLLMVPVFDRGIYKFFEKCGRPISPFMRIFTGLVFTALSFVCSGFLQIQLESQQLFVGWQLPQYVLITAGEIMVAITGLEFAYTQSPIHMKSLVISCYLMTVAVGNAIILVVTEFVNLSQWVEFFVYAVVMLISAILFAFIALNYNTNINEKNKATGNAKTENNEEKQSLLNITVSTNE